MFGVRRVPAVVAMFLGLAVLVCALAPGPDWLLIIREPLFSPGAMSLVAAVILVAALQAARGRFGLTNYMGGVIAAGAAIAAGLIHRDRPTDGPVTMATAVLVVVFCAGAVLTFSSRRAAAVARASRLDAPTPT